MSYTNILYYIIQGIIILFYYTIRRLLCKRRARTMVSSKILRSFDTYWYRCNITITNIPILVYVLLLLL